MVCWDASGGGRAEDTPGGDTAGRRVHPSPRRLRKCEEQFLVFLVLSPFPASTALTTRPLALSRGRPAKAGPPVVSLGGHLYPFDSEPRRIGASARTTPNRNPGSAGQVRPCAARRRAGVKGGDSGPCCSLDPGRAGPGAFARVYALRRRAPTRLRPRAYPGAQPQEWSRTGRGPSHPGPWPSGSAASAWESYWDRSTGPM